MKIVLVSLLFILMSAFVSAADVSHTSTILSVDQQSNGDLALSFNTDHAACTNGNSPNKAYYVRVGQGGVTVDIYKNFLTMATTAGMTKKTVSIVFNDATNACWVNRMIVTF